MSQQHESAAASGDNGRVGRVLQRVSLRSRVILLTAICVGGAVALASVGAFVTVRTSLYSQLEQNLADRAVEAAHSKVVVEGVIPAAVFTTSDLLVGILGAHGLVYPIDAASRPPYGPIETSVVYGGGCSLPRTDDRTDKVVVACQVRPGTAIVFAQSLRPTQSLLARLSLVLLFLGIGGVLVAALAGTAVAQGGLRPVARLRQATERVANTGDLTPIPVSGDDELALLTTSFNTMLGTLAESQERQRRLVADAGHELRTPLTSLRTNLELLLASEKPGAPTLSQQDRDEIYDDVKAQLAELTTLVGDLVELAREDAPQAIHEPVELVEVVERALNRARRRGSGVRFVTHLRPWFLLGEAHALERAVLNLLDNAIKFSPEGGTVRLDMRACEDGTMLVQVADAGPGIAEADLPHVFERFYRSSEARTLPGSGLGLAIVAQVTARHGGTVVAGSAPEGGALMTMKLPGRPSS
ncbi:MAG: HAMP domain-containing histidine kinase [Kutzneria sp.]|nr:HAMP domain-containing histidine kinase [Kutzneria sp.]